MVAGDGVLRIVRAGNLLRLAGDIDEATHADLAAALDDVADEPGDIHVDMAKVEFCGLAGLRAFVLLSQARHPAMIIVAGASPCTTRPRRFRLSCRSLAGTPPPG